MNLLDLPKDIIKKLLNEYFHPSDALKCMRTCKRLNQLVDKELVVKNLLFSRCLEEYQCRLREKMIRVYGLRGGLNFFPFFISSSPESEELAFEQEYLDWKNAL